MASTFILVEVRTDKPANDPARQEISAMVLKAVKERFLSKAYSSETSFRKLSDGNQPEIEAVSVRSAGTEIFV